MKLLPFKYGRKNAAGIKNLAAFFLLFVLNFSSYAQRIPFVIEGKLFSVEKTTSAEKSDESQKKISRIFDTQDFNQRFVSKAEKNNFLVLWKKNQKKLLYINQENKIVQQIDLDASSVYLNENFIFAQKNSFDESAGFGFVLYKIEYSRFFDKIKLKARWNGEIDCFVSDYFFTEDGICICGGTRDNLRHNVYKICENGIHRCFSMQKNGNFMRILKSPCNQNEMYAFLSSRDKSKKDALIYSFEIDGLSDLDSVKKIDLRNCSEKNKFCDVLKDFDSFFGYGFVFDECLVLPASINQIVSFVKFNPFSRKIENVVSKTGGCNFALGRFDENLFCYIAKDPLIAQSYYGLAFYDGKSCIFEKEFETSKN